MNATLVSTPTRSLTRSTYAAAGIGSAVLFAFVGWATQSLLRGDSLLVAVLTALTGFVFFGWIAVVVLAVLGALGAVLLASVAIPRRWRRATTVIAGTAGWMAVAVLPAALGAPLMSGSGFSLPEVIPAAAVAGLFGGFIVGRHVTFADAD